MCNAVNMKRLILALLFSSLSFLAVPGTTHAAIAVDNSAHAQGTAAAISVSYTVTSNTNGLMLAWVENGTTDTIVSVTYAGVAMTKYQFFSGNAPDNLSLYYLYTPTAGANTFAVVWSIAPPSPEAIIVSYTGVQQSGFPDAVSTVQTQTAGTSITTTLTPVATGAWGVMFNDLNRAFSSATNYTRRPASFASNLQVGDTNGTISGATSMSITQSSSSSMWGVMVSIAPVVVVPPVYQGTQLLINGVSFILNGARLILP